jgi:cohesin complex subunit SA-1/2
MMRGAQLAVVRKLEGQHVIAIHTQLLSWIAKRLGAYENNKNQRKKELAVLFFRVLQPLLAPLDNRDALAMYVPNDIRDVADQISPSSKAYLEQVLAQAKVKVSATSSTWEPHRAYERRLTNIMSKIKGLQQKSSTLIVC